MPEFQIKGWAKPVLDRSQMSDKVKHNILKNETDFGLYWLLFIIQWSQQFAHIYILYYVIVIIPMTGFRLPRVPGVYLKET